MQNRHTILALSIIIFLVMNQSFSQVAINTDGSSAVPSAILDIKSTNKGLLPPRVNLASVSDVTTIASPVAGLMVYNTNANITNGCGVGFYYFNASKWVKLASNTMHYLGEWYGGGHIFWLDETGEHGLIAAPSDQGSVGGIRWHNGTFKITGATADGVYAGKHNTDKIIASQGVGAYAAILCRDHTYTNSNVFYTDWYLPSKYELNLMYQNRALLAPFNSVSGIYWSSTEGTANPTNMAFEQEFMTGGGGFQDEGQKDWQNQVRCIRKF